MSLRPEVNIIDLIRTNGGIRGAAQLEKKLLAPLIRSAMVVVIRGGAPSALAPALRESVWAMDKYQPIGSINTMNQVLSARRARQLHKGLCDRTPSGDVLLTHIDHHRPAAGIDMRQPPLARLRLQPSHNQILENSWCLCVLVVYSFAAFTTKTPGHQVHSAATPAKGLRDRRE